jgi:hypothetical protein
MLSQRCRRLGLHKPKDWAGAWKLGEK